MVNNKQQCLMCLNEKALSGFYKSKSKLHRSGIVPYCKDCLNSLDLLELDILVDVLQKIDIPYVKKIWDNVIEKNEKGLLGKYLKVIAIQYPDKTFKDSDSFKENIHNLMKLNKKIDSKKKKLNKIKEELNENKEIQEQERIEKQIQEQEKFDIDKMEEKWGIGFKPSDYVAFEKKFNSLKGAIPNQTKLHIEALLTYIRYQVKAEQSIAEGNADDAKKWGELAKNSAKQAKITPEQLTSADLSQGIDSFSTLVREVEKAVDIIPLMPNLIYTPKDKADMIIHTYINYERDLHGLPPIEYKDIYDFYNKQVENYIKEFPETYVFLKEEEVMGDTQIERVYNYVFNVVIPKKKKENPDSKFYQNLEKWIELVSYWRFYPDMWYEIISPVKKNGGKKGVRLSLDQRVNLRAMARFKHFHAVLSRGSGKTFLNQMFFIHSAIFYPDTSLALSAQTKDNSASLISAKFKEIINFYPILEKEYYPAPKSSIESKTNVLIKFKSGGEIDNLVNAQSSKGQRRRKLIIEESAQINNKLFIDALEPIPNVARKTIGDLTIDSPIEMHGQIHFFTTSWYRGTSEFERCLKFFDDMINLRGTFILGASYELNLLAERGESRSTILAKRDSDPIFFALNYESKWVGAGEGALISIDKLMDLRNIETPETERNKKSDNEYILSVDVARSVNSDNNQSSVCVLKITRKKDESIQNVSLINIINYPSNKSFEELSIEIKKLKIKFDAKAIVVDTNGLGIGLLEYLGKEQFDTITNESLGAFKPFNEKLESAEKYAEEIIFSLKSQHINREIIINFQDYVENKKLRLLKKKDIIDNNLTYSNDEIVNKVVPFVQTDLLVDEIANLKLDISELKTFKLSRLSRKIDKDRYSALAYGLYYIKKFEEQNTTQANFDISKYFLFKK
ncbi:MAG: hypothetical protein ACLUCH_07725 [Lachnospirales bacterium]